MRVIGRVTTVAMILGNLFSMVGTRFVVVVMAYGGKEVSDFLESICEKRIVTFYPRKPRVKRGSGSKGKISNGMKPGFIRRSVYKQLKELSK